MKTKWHQDLKFPVLQTTNNWNTLKSTFHSNAIDRSIIFIIDEKIYGTNFLKVLFAILNTAKFSFKLISQNCYAENLMCKWRNVTGRPETNGLVASSHSIYIYNQFMPNESTSNHND